MAMILVGSGKRVAVLVYDGVEPLDFIGPVEVFAADHGHFEVFTVAPREGTITTGIGALVVTPAHTFADCPPAEILVVPGGGTGPISRDPEALRFIRRRAEESEVVLSVCSGSFILGAAGLLDGLTVTAHRGDLDELRRAVPGAKVVDARFVDNGRIVTAGGVSSGIDAALHVLGRLHGRETRDRVAEYLQHRPEPGTVVDH
jgi:transcriptional regulator GlxA family with amidase domain